MGRANQFVKVPLELLSKGLGASEIVTYMALLSFDRIEKTTGRYRGTCYPSIDTIARRTGWRPIAERNGRAEAGVSPRVVSRALNGLIAAGCITRLRRANKLDSPGRLSSQYTLHIHAEGMLLSDEAREALAQEAGWAECQNGS